MSEIGEAEATPAPLKFEHPDKKRGYENPQLKSRIEREEAWGNHLTDFVNRVNNGKEPNSTILELATHLVNIEDTSGKGTSQLDALAEEVYTDVKTGLRNEKGFLQDLEQTKSGSLALLDIDRFKGINDQFGHDAGDVAIVHYAKLVEQAVNLLNKRLKNTDEKAQAYLLHGDESAVIVPEMSPQETKAFIDEIIDSVSKNPLVYNAIPISLAVSVGAAKVQQDEGALTNYKNVDRLLYEAKKNGRGRSFVDGIDNIDVAQAA